jgi:hypothetical protein
MAPAVHTGLENIEVHRRAHEHRPSIDPGSANDLGAVPLSSRLEVRIFPLEVEPGVAGSSAISRMRNQICGHLELGRPWN